MEPMRRSCAAVVVVILMFLTAWPVDCAGWEPTSQGRMECCQRAGHDCDEQSMADDCCGRSEERQQDRSTVQGFFLPVLSIVAVPVPSFLALPHTSSLLAIGSRLGAWSHPPAYLLTTPLLI